MCIDPLWFPLMSLMRTTYLGTYVSTGAIERQNASSYTEWPFRAKPCNTFCSSIPGQNSHVWQSASSALIAHAPPDHPGADRLVRRPTIRLRMLWREISLWKENNYVPLHYISTELEWMYDRGCHLPGRMITLRKVAAPSSRTILRTQSISPAYRPESPWVIKRVLTTSRGVVTNPVMAPATAPVARHTQAYPALREPSSHGSKGRPLARHT
jgi:hypothetical protein